MGVGGGGGGYNYAPSVVCRSGWGGEKPPPPPPRTISNVSYNLLIAETKFSCKILILYIKAYNLLAICLKGSMTHLQNIVGALKEIQL